MLEAAKAALEKAGFTIESLRNRIKELESENAKLKEPKTCENCALYDADDMICNHEDIPEFDVPMYINMSGCGLHKSKDH